jgi:uncharacterized membrane-anchored protein YjiN (DUF445 family)
MGTDSRRKEFFRMRALATGLLAGMFLLFLAAALLQAEYPWLGYVRAFAEAAMVGALADWFAVTALFRHPLGIPIPHTAVIPRNKERIGESLGTFVGEHFLPPDVVRAQLARVDLGELIGRWLADPDRAASLSNEAARLLPGLFEALDDERVRGFVRGKLSGRLEAVDLAPLAGDILAALAADRRHQRLLDAVLVQIAVLIMEKEPFIREKIRDSTGWLWKKLSVDQRAFNGIMRAIGQLLHDMGENAEHELRQRFDQVVEDFIRKLKESADYQERAEALKRQLLANPDFQYRLEELWEDLRLRLLADVKAPESEIRRLLQTAVVQLGEALLTQPSLREGLNPWLRDSLADLVESRRQEVARLIPDTMRTWDADTMAERLELQVGSDLQFIRINGTLVGGLVGLGIYTAAKLAGI